MANKSTTMERQKSKFIYDFVPWNTFNHAHNNLSGRIMSLNEERETDGTEDEDDLPEKYVVSRVHRLITKWQNSEIIRDDLDAETIELVKPGSASYHVYPRTFECNNCGSVNKFDSDDIEYASKAHVDASTIATCDACDTPLSDRDQLPFVAICECGAIDELYVPDCCGTNMAFKRPTTRMGDWKWECVNPNCSNGDGGSTNTVSFFRTNVYCPDADCENEDMEVINHTDSSAYYAQVGSLINVDPQLDNLHGSETYRARIVSDYLLHGGDVGKPSDAEVQDAAASILGGPQEYFDADDDERRKAEEEAHQTLMTDVAEHRDRIHQYLNSTYEYDETELAEEIYEFLSVVDPDYEPQGGMETISYEDMRENNANNTHLTLPQVNERINIRDRLNLDEVRLIKDFPITTVTYGFTRTAGEPPGEDRTPGRADADLDEQAEDETRKTSEETSGETSEETDESEADGEDDRPVQLRLFRKGKYSAPQLYYQTNDAEAVFIKLDKGLVLDWLEENDVVSSDRTPDRDDTEAVRQWFIDTLIKPHRYESLPDDGAKDTPERVSRYCYSLLNTTAHLFINGMGALAGHQRESLVEHLMPRTMSFVIYKRPDTSFALGSLWTMFEEQFDDFETHLDELNDCSYDPVCMHDENGACEDCLYLAAISTENVNHNLGRGTFYGGQFDGDDVTGFKEL